MPVIKKDVSPRPLDVSSPPPTSGVGVRMSGDETSILTGAGGSLSGDYLDASELLDDLETGEKDEGADEDITSIPINQVHLI